MSSYSNKQVVELGAERTADPLGRGYSGMTDQQFDDSVNAEDITVERTTMSAGEIMEQIDGAEFNALDAANTVRVDRVLGLGAEIIVGPGNNHNAVQELLATFGGTSATIASLAALRELNKTSRRAQKGWPPCSVSTVLRIL